MTKTLALALVLGVTVSAAATSQESAAKQPVANPVPAAKPPAKVGSPAHKQSSGTTRNKAAQVPNQVSAGNPTVAAQKRDARTADGPASNDDATQNVSKKSAVKKKKTDAPADDKAKPQS